MKKLDTFVLCTTDDTDLGLKGDDIWLPCKIDLSAVIAVKKNGKGENDDKAVLYFHGDDYFVIDMVYEEFIKIWE